MNSHRITRGILVGILGGIITLILSQGTITGITYAGLFVGASLVALSNNRYKFNTTMQAEAIVIYIANLAVLGIYRLFIM